MPAVFPKKIFHGGKTFSAEDGTEILNVSASLNPFAPVVSAEFTLADVGEYPDDSYAELKERIGGVFHRSVDEICVGNGSVELMRVYCQAVSGRRCRIDVPTFGEYALSAEIAGKRVVSYPDDWDVRFVCNPNNPTGTMFERDEVLAIVAEADKCEKQVFVDEAFMDLAETNESVSDVRADNLFVLRSLTKSFAVPGLRFGFGFGSAALVERMETIRPPWSVNSFAERFAMRALEQYAELRHSVAGITAEREWWFDQLEGLHLPYFAAKANFICIYMGRSAAEVTEEMLKAGVYVRDCTSFGLPENIRISVETRDKNKRVLEALAGCLH